MHPISVRKQAERGQLFNSGLLDGMDFDKAFEAIVAELEPKGQCTTTNFRLRDWGVSRQRYWGAPIPMMTLENGDVVGVPLQDLPVELPEDVVLDGIRSPIKADPNWAKTQYQGKSALRETDTFDTFMESSWYYARYCLRITKKACESNASIIGYRLINTSVVLSMHVCICCMRVSSTNYCVMKVWSKAMSRLSVYCA